MLIIAFFVSVISVMVHQMITREEYDVRIMYAGQKIFTETERTDIHDALAQLGKDYDGDGVKNAQMFDLIIMTEAELLEAYDAGYNPYYLNTSTINENKETLTLHAMANEFTLLFLSPENYNLLRKHNLLVPLANLGYEEELPAAAIDEYAVLLSDLDASIFFSGFACLPDDTVVCIKRISESKDGKSKADKLQNDHIDFFKSLVAFELPADYVPPSQQENVTGEEQPKD